MYIADSLCCAAETNTIVKQQLLFSSSVSNFSVQFLANLWTVAHQAPLSLGFLRQEYWRWLPFPPPGDLPDPGMELTTPASPALAGKFFTTEPSGKPKQLYPNLKKKSQCPHTGVSRGCRGNPRRGQGRLRGDVASEPSLANKPTLARWRDRVGGKTMSSFRSPRLQ